MSTVGNTITTGVAYADPSLASLQVRGNLGVYGATPVSQRTYTAAVHNTTGIAVSASFGATQLAAVQEIQKTFIGLGIYATA